MFSQKMLFTSNVAPYDINVNRYEIKFEELVSYNLYSEELWNVMKGLFEAF